LLYLAAVLDGRSAWFFEPAHWARWDSGIYLTIAGHGYSLVHCTGSLYPPHSWCGTTGWAPLYPLLMAGLGQLGLSLAGAGVVLAALFAFLSLQALWILIGPAWNVSRLCCLALAACFPGMVYYYALYPISLITFLSVVCLILFIRRQYVAAGLVGALCAWAFASGPLIAGILLVSAVLVDRGPQFWRVIVQTTGVALGGFLALLLATQILVGNWQGYLMTQTKYSNGLHDPFATFATAFTGGTPAKYILLSPNPAYDHVIPQAQTALVAALVIGIAVWTFRQPVSRSSWVILAYTGIIWLAPFVDGSTLARYRIEALLVPCVALCTRLPRVVLVVLVGTSAVIGVGMATLYSQSILF
jgi:hypothetical protein